MKRLLFACAVIALVLGIAGIGSQTRAAGIDFIIQSLDCSSPLGRIRVQKVGNTDNFLGHLGVAITPVSGAPFGPVDVSTLIPDPGPLTTVSPGAILDLQVGPGAITKLATAGQLTTNDSIAISPLSLLQPGAFVQLFDGATPIPGATALCPLLPLSRTRTVSTQGFDFIAPGVPNTICGQDLTLSAIPTPVLPGPCFTIGNALTYARDGDTIVVESGIYEVCSTLEVSKLVNITAGAASAAANSKVILHSFSGESVFHVTTIGASVGPTGIPQHATINGFAIGGAFQPAQAAIVLDGDAYTDVTNNVLGGEQLNNPNFTGEPCPPTQPPLPTGFGFAPPPPVTKLEVFGNAASIILQNSDHPNITSNSILGSSTFKFAPILTPGKTLTGFGIVSAECLGLQSDVSDSVTIASNLINRNSNAGIWLCSDGGGSHSLKSNTVRNNGRGIVLRAIVDSTVDANTISNNRQDGLIIYDSAINNILSNNTIESHRTPGAAGIRLGGFGASLFPLQTVMTGNKLLRNWVGLVIAGARNTSGTNNVITADDARTGVLLTVGAAGSPNVTQPVGTVFRATNRIIANGACGANQGCAVRMDSFVTVDADFSQAEFGLPAETDVNTVLWHKPNDPSLGYIKAGQQIPSASASPAPGNASATPASSTTPAAGRTPTAGATAAPGAVGPTRTPTPSPTPIFCIAINTPPGCVTTPTPMSPAQAGAIAGQSSQSNARRP